MPAAGARALDGTLMDPVRAAVATLIHSVADWRPGDRSPASLRDTAWSVACRPPGPDCPICRTGRCGTPGVDCALGAFNRHTERLPLDVPYAAECALSLVVAGLRFLAAHITQDINGHELHLLARLVADWEPGDLCALCGRPPGHCVVQTPTTIMCPLRWTMAPPMMRR